MVPRPSPLVTDRNRTCPIALPSESCTYTRSVPSVGSGSGLEGSLTANVPVGTTTAEATPVMVNAVSSTTERLEVLAGQIKYSSCSATGRFNTAARYMSAAGSTTRDTLRSYPKFVGSTWSRSTPTVTSPVDCAFPGAIRAGRRTYPSRLKPTISLSNDVRGANTCTRSRPYWTRHSPNSCTCHH